ncbi:MAG: hypothetical protein GEV03_16980 [Streptosporangiales bacterium]|nr:hypothetical protein [Streptosporangiales bacterium]
MVVALPPGYCVEYLDAEERERFRLFVFHGLLYSVTGRPFDTSDATSYWGNGDRRGIFAMDRYGNIYASSKHEVGRFHHSSFLAGEPVGGAGELEVINGRLIFLSDRSGHYMPEPEFLEQVVRRLTEDGIDFRGVEIRHWWEPRC